MKTNRLPLCLGLAAALVIVPASAQQPAPTDLYSAAHAANLKGDFDGAIKLYDQALGLDPKSLNAYYGRGFAKLHNGDINGALADFNQDIALNPKYVDAYYGRGVTEQVKGSLDSAIADYQTLLALNPPGGDNPHFYLWIARSQQNQKADADRELTDYMTKRATTHKVDWHSKIGDYLLGKLTDTQLNTIALSFPDPVNQSRAQCEAWYFVGMKRLLAGDKAAAADNFRKCLGTNQTILTQYPLAKAAADALALNPGD